MVIKDCGAHELQRMYKKIQNVVLFVVINISTDAALISSDLVLSNTINNISCHFCVPYLLYKHTYNVAVKTLFCSLRFLYPTWHIVVQPVFTSIAIGVGPNICYRWKQIQVLIPWINILQYFMIGTVKVSIQLSISIGAVKFSSCTEI